MTAAREARQAKVRALVRGRQERKLRARRETHKHIWFGLGMFGMVGWSVAIPAVIAVTAGVWLDKHHPGRISWTITLLAAGMVLGCWNAWRWVNQEREKGLHEEPPPPADPIRCPQGRARASRVAGLGGAG